jgi:valyl-tRNA synthetase
MSAESFQQSQKWIPYFMVLAKVEGVSRGDLPSGKRAIFTPLGGLYIIGIEVPEAFDFQVARKRLGKQLDEVNKHKRQFETRLNDENFRYKADPETVFDAQKRYDVLEKQQYLLSAQLSVLEGSN